MQHRPAIRSKSAIAALLLRAFRFYPSRRSGPGRMFSDRERDTSGVTDRILVHGVVICELNAVPRIWRNGVQRAAAKRRQVIL